VETGRIVSEGVGENVMDGVKLGVDVNFTVGVLISVLLVFWFGVIVDRVDGDRGTHAVTVRINISIKQGIFTKKENICVMFNKGEKVKTRFLIPTMEGENGRR
jgi:hypothetical protein